MSKQMDLRFVGLTHAATKHVLGTGISGATGHVVQSHMGFALRSVLLVLVIIEGATSCAGPGKTLDRSAAAAAIQTDTKFKVVKWGDDARRQVVGSRELISVTGIAMQGENSAVVRFTYKVVPTPGLNPNQLLLLDGQSEAVIFGGKQREAEAQMLLYDSGWRVQRFELHEPGTFYLE